MKEIQFGDTVIVGDNADKLIESQNFRKWWFKRIDSSRFMRGTRIFERDSIWSREGELVFAFFLIEYFDEEQKEKRNIIFYRRDAVGVLLILKNKATGDKYVVLVEQLRAPSGQKLLEIPAGTIENNDDPLETAVREVEEEVTLKIAQKDLHFLIQYFPSSGACTEKINLYYCELELSEQEIASLAGRSAGLKEEGESTRVMIFPLASFNSLGIMDGKALTAYGLYLQETQK